VEGCPGICPAIYFMLSGYIPLSVLLQRYLFSVKMAENKPRHPYNEWCAFLIAMMGYVNYHALKGYGLPSPQLRQFNSWESAIGLIPTGLLTRPLPGIHWNHRLPFDTRPAPICFVFLRKFRHLRRVRLLEKASLPEGQQAIKC